MFLGQYSSKLTDKDRLAVPKKFRNELGSDLVVARWYETCLVLVAKEKFDRLKFRLTGGERLVISPVRDIDRFFLGGAYEIKLDNQGRFIVPGALLTYGEIKEEVVFVGLGDRVEIWAMQKWVELEKVSETRAKQALEKISNE